MLAIRYRNELPRTPLRVVIEARGERAEPRVQSPDLEEKERHVDDRQWVRSSVRCRDTEECSELDYPSSPPTSSTGGHASSAGSPPTAR